MDGVPDLRDHNSFTTKVSKGIKHMHYLYFPDKLARGQTLGLVSLVVKD